MIDLLRAELLRVISRRLSIFALAATLIIVSMATLTVSDSIRPVSEADRARAAADFRTETERWEEECGNSTTSDPANCATWERPEPEQFLREPISFEDAHTGAMAFIWFLVLLVVFTVSTSLVGAEFSNGTLATQLTFTPRRIPVLWAKAGAATLASLALGVISSLSLLLLVTMTFALARGSGEMEMTMGLLLGHARFILVCVIIGLGCALVTMAVGSSLTTWGIAALVVVGSSVLLGVPGAPQVLLRLLPLRYLVALLEGEVRYAVWSHGPDRPPYEVVITYPQALLYATVVLALVSVIAMAAQRLP